MQVTSLMDLRQQLAGYLSPLLPEGEILYSMPSVRRPLAAAMTTLVLSDQRVKRREATVGGSPLPRILLHHGAGADRQMVTKSG